MADPVVRIRGLTETTQAFKRLQGRVPAELRKAMKEIADHVVGVAQQRMPHRTGEAQRSLKPKGTNKGAAITFPDGGTPWRGIKADYYPWLDFGGGKAGARGITSSSPVAHAKHLGGFKRPVIGGGRFLYPAIWESHGFVREAADEALERAIKGEGFNTSGHA